VKSWRREEVYWFCMYIMARISKLKNTQMADSVFDLNVYQNIENDDKRVHSKYELI